MLDKFNVSPHVVCKGNLGDNEVNVLAGSTNVHQLKDIAFHRRECVGIIVVALTFVCRIRPEQAIGRYRP